MNGLSMLSMLMATFGVDPMHQGPYRRGRGTALENSKRAKARRKRQISRRSRSLNHRRNK